jgi:hypothetical protein
MMKPLLWVGVVLVVIGLAGLLYGGITYRKSQETADLGIVKVTLTEHKRWSLHPALGGVILAAGIVVIVASVRRPRPAP